MNGSGHSPLRGAAQGGWLLLAAACAWLACTAWLRPLALPDEGRYVGVAWEMLRAGDWSVPTLDGLPYFHKPPLFYWITVAAMTVFGEHAWAARAAPMASGWLMVASCWLFARRWCDTQGRLAWIGALATMPLVFVGAQYANTDMLVAGCITACVLGCAHAVLAPQPRQQLHPALLAGYAFGALGVLAKGLIGAALPGLVLLAWLAVLRRPAWILRLLSLPGLLVFAIVGAPWFVAMEQRFPGFAHYFFGVQHFSRFTGSGFNNAQPFWFYPVVIAALAFPWTGWLLSRRLAPREGEPTDTALPALMWTWLVAVVAFFSLPTSKLIGYVLPAMAPLAWLVARAWARAWHGGGRAHALAGATVALAAVLCVAAVVVAAVVPQKSSAAIAAAMAQERAQAVVAIQDYPFDLPFLARLRVPMFVVERWQDPKVMQADSWRRELWDATAFAPARAGVLLEPQALAAAGSCPGALSWVIAPPDVKAAYPMLAQARQVAATHRLALWQVRDWAPTAAACDAGKPSVS